MIELSDFHKNILEEYEAYLERLAVMRQEQDEFQNEFRKFNKDNCVALSAIDNYNRKIKEQSRKDMKQMRIQRDLVIIDTIKEGDWVLVKTNNGNKVKKVFSVGKGSIECMGFQHPMYVRTPNRNWVINGKHNNSDHYNDIIGYVANSIVGLITHNEDNVVFIERFKL